MPIGTLTKKIHCQPSPSTSTPPASGPTSVATPAVAPQTLIAHAAALGGEDPGDRGQRLRGEQRRADALHDAGGDQHLDGAGTGRTTATPR